MGFSVLAAQGSPWETKTAPRQAAPDQGHHGRWGRPRAAAWAGLAGNARMQPRSETARPEWSWVCTPDSAGDPRARASAGEQAQRPSPGRQSRGPRLSRGDPSAEGGPAPGPGSAAMALPNPLLLLGLSFSFGRMRVERKGEVHSAGVRDPVLDSGAQSVPGAGAEMGLGCVPWGLPIPLTSSACGSAGPQRVAEAVPACVGHLSPAGGGDLD